LNIKRVGNRIEYIRGFCFQHDTLVEQAAAAKAIYKKHKARNF